MNSSIKTKMPGRTIGNFAFAGSLFLHVGLIAIFSSWQWDLTSPRKTTPEFVKVKFIAAPPLPQPTETQKSSQRTSVPPVQPKTTQPHSNHRHVSRTPNFSSPTLSPVKTPRRMTRSKVKSINHVMVQPVGFTNSEQTPKKARQMTKLESKSVKRTSAQPSAIISTPLLTAVIPESFSPSNQSTVIRRRSPVFGTRASGFSNIPAQTAIVAGSAISNSKMIHRLPSSTQSMSLSQISIAPEAVVVPSTSNNTMMNKFSALPRKLPQNLTADPDASGTDLKGLRGLFTGRVRQQIAKAKYYPRIARRRGMEGQPIIAFTLDKGGRIINAALEKTSGYQLLDQAALKAVRQAAPYPEIPAPLRMDSFQFKLPISFILK